jgi:hypothetical protein
MPERGPSRRPPRAGMGRPPGAKNKASVLREKLVAAGGETPLDYLLMVMRDENNDRATRMAAAVAAAPYVHPRLAAVKHTGDDDAPVTIQVSWATKAQKDAAVSAALRAHQ